MKDTACHHVKSVSAARCTAGRTTHAQRCNATSKWSKKKTRRHANHIAVLSSGVETTHPKTPRLGSRLLATKKIIGEHKNKSMQPNFQRVRLCLLGTKPENVQCEPLTRISRPHVVASVRSSLQRSKSREWKTVNRAIAFQSALKHNPAQHSTMHCLPTWR